MTAQPTRKPMVGWYDPKQLIRTGSEVLISTLFGKYSDQRIIQALASGGTLIHDFSSGGLSPAPQPLPVEPPSEFWFDYVADMGDGWDSTYAVAYAIAHGNLPLKDAAGVAVPNERGRLLIFGGDEVYPVASREEYHDRLVAPYSAAFDQHPRRWFPTIFGIPGNHDWYDNLVSFSRLFCSDEPFAGGCDTPQKRSYFAIKLPHGWWLLGNDVQLGSDLDGPQYDFFQSVAKQMAPSDRVILCTAEPHWMFEELLPPTAGDGNALGSLEKILKDRIAVFLSGDVHHYCRYESTASNVASDKLVQKITAGGGGAFLHPSHGPLDIPQLEKGAFQRRQSFPTPEQSRGLAWGNLLFVWKNKWFGLLPAILYVVILWGLMPAIEQYPSDKEYGLYKEPLFKAFWHLTLDPDVDIGHLHRRILMYAMGVLLAGVFMLFTTLRKNRFLQAMIGILHAMTHYVSAIALSWGISVLLFEFAVDFHPLEHTFFVPTRFWIATIAIFVSGWIVGSVIMGLYLLIMLNVFREHWNEAFSSLAIKDWKNFVRFKIDSQGALTIYPIGLQKVPRHWHPRTSGESGSAIIPDDAFSPVLIESPIRLTK